MIQTTNLTRTREDNISVACADCPNCGKEKVVARVASARSGFNGSAEREITCKQCHTLFKTPENALAIRRHAREHIDAEYGLSALTWIE
jgi:transcription elongation factor Elf1